MPVCFTPDLYPPIWEREQASRASVLHPFLLTVFLPDHWHLIPAPAYPLTVSVVMKLVATAWFFHAVGSFHYALAKAHGTNRVPWLPP